MPKDPIELLCTLGPASMNETVIGRLADLGVTLFRINLAHTKAGDLTQAIEFYNSWGDVLTWHPNIRHYRYEDLKADPVSTHKEIFDFWGFDVPEDRIAEGFRRASKVEMKKRMPPAERNRNPRVPDRSAAHRGAISEARTRHIIDRLKRELVHTLGHEYDHGTTYGREYD